MAPQKAPTHTTPVKAACGNCTIGNEASTASACFDIYLTRHNDTASIRRAAAEYNTHLAEINRYREMYANAPDQASRGYAQYHIDLQSSLWRRANEHRVRVVDLLWKDFETVHGKDGAGERDEHGLLTPQKENASGSV